MTGSRHDACFKSYSSAKPLIRIFCFPTSLDTDFLLARGLLAIEKETTSIIVPDLRFTNKTDFSAVKLNL